MKALLPPSLELIHETRRCISPHVLRTPLVHYQGEGGFRQIYLKLENLQPTGSFKIRGAASAILQTPPEVLARGVWTASAGNMAQGLARFAHTLGLSCTVIVPEDAPQTKIDAIVHLGAAIIPLPFQQYQQVQRMQRLDGMAGVLIHPFADTHVMAGNATIALEIMEDLPDVETVLVPYGGGGLSCGIASAFNILKPEVRVFACEVATGAPLAASFAAGKPVEIHFTPSFVSGMGAPFVFPQMWSLASRLLAGSKVVSLEQVACCIQLLAVSNHIVAEPAGAVALAAALSMDTGTGKTACIVSGGNIDASLFAKILAGEKP